jgi:hypothetical protein
VQRALPLPKPLADIFEESLFDFAQWYSATSDPVVKLSKGELTQEFNDTRMKLLEVPHVKKELFADWVALNLIIRKSRTSVASFGIVIINLDIGVSYCINSRIKIVTGDKV